MVLLERYTDERDARSMSTIPLLNFFSLLRERSHRRREKKLSKGTVLAFDR